MWPHITPAGEGEDRHLFIHIPLGNMERDLCYFGNSHYFEDYEKLNRYLEKHDCIVPDDEVWCGTGANKNMEILTDFDNEGNKIEMRILKHNDNGITMRTWKKIKRVYNPHEQYTAALVPCRGKIKSIEDPNLIRFKLDNHYGLRTKSGLYYALPANCRNPRIYRGNGIIDWGPYKFAYSERYVAENETLVLEGTYLE